MKTIKLPIMNDINIEEIQRIFSSAVRFSYNRLLENKSEKEIRSLIKEKFTLGSWLSQCAIKEAAVIKDSQVERKQKKVIFGSSKLFKKRAKNEISNQEWKASRFLSITSQGELLQKGNRHFQLDLSNNQIIFKISKKNHITIQLPKLRKNYKKELTILEYLSLNKKLPFQVKVNKEFIWITFDESKLYEHVITPKNDKRILGIDLNPSYIGLSILEFSENDAFKVLHKEMIELKALNKCSTDKKDFEFYHISKRIISLCNNFNCLKLSVEDLNIKAKNHGKGKWFNKLVNNDWNRSILINSLKKHCNIFKIEFVLVNAVYSSTIGNLLYGDENTPDMIASSIEIARRGYKKFSKNWFYPPNIEFLMNTMNQWKKDLCSRFNDWKSIHNEIKNSKLKYRVPLTDCKINTVFRNNSIKSKVLIYTYCIS